MAQPAAAASAAPTKAPEKEKEVDKKRLYVRWEVTDDTLKNAFEKYGKITETRVVRGPRLRAFGFLTFETEEAAARAMADMNTKSIPAGPLAIEFASKEGAARARDKKERKTRVPKDPKDVKTDDKNSKSGDSKRGGRTSGGRGGAKAGNAAGGGGAKDSKRGGRKSRRGRRGGGAAGGDGERSDAKRENKRDDPNWGKVVRLVPDPVSTPIAKDSALTEIVAGQRAYKAGRTDAKSIASLVLNADPTKGPFNCDFTLGSFALKLLEVRVSAKEGDVRVGCRVVHPDSNRSREVYLRVRGNEHKHKFLELRLPVPKGPDGKEKEDTSTEVESFFVTIDSITLDVKTGLWKRLMLSLVSMMVPRRARS
jgi:heterogeneous nuclear ribonucleoprotein G